MKNRLMTYIFMAGAFLCSCGGGKSANVSGKAEIQPEQMEKVSFNADSAMAYLKMQTDAGPRVPGSQAHAKTADLLISLLGGFNPDTLMVQSAEMTLPGTEVNVPMKNIFAQWGADRPARILLLAHWDTRPHADQDSDPSNHNVPFDGANDGASGVAVLLEIARGLSGSLPENYGVDILLADLEDAGTADDDLSWCLGTQYFAQNLPYKPDATPRFAILLDMVGGAGARFHREYFSDRYASDIVDHVWNVASKSGYATYFTNQPGNPINDDHIPLNRAGIPTIDIIENKNPITGTFNPTWHTMDDNFSNIDPATIKAVGQTVTNLIHND
ncbi:MAG: M28 family peptidase [Muribaculaceae bacterium]|nr:M28 family peptidase [Muribaculaceae bacterium]